VLVDCMEYGLLILGGTTDLLIRPNTSIGRDSFSYLAY
jgi:hypothetical protein